MSSRSESPNSLLEWLKWSVVVILVAATLIGNYYYSDYSLLARVLVMLVVTAVSVAIALTTERGHSFNQLRKESWIEVRKVVWPTRQETIQTTLVVMAVVVVVALLLWLVDTLLGLGIAWVVGA